MQSSEKRYGLTTKAAQVSSSDLDDTRRLELNGGSGTNKFRWSIQARSMRVIASHLVRNQAKILSIGDDERLLETRQMVFASAGYDVLSANSADDLDNDLVQKFDIAVVCHSVPTKRAAQLAEFLHNINPALPILRLGDFRTGPEDRYDLILQFPPKPELLLKTLEQLLLRPM